MLSLLAISGFQQQTVTRVHLTIIQEEFQGIKQHLPRALASPHSVQKAVSGRHTDVLCCLLFLSLPHTPSEVSSSCRNCPSQLFCSVLESRDLFRLCSPLRPSSWWLSTSFSCRLLSTSNLGWIPTYNQTKVEQHWSKWGWELRAL